MKYNRWKQLLAGLTGGLALGLALAAGPALAADGDATKPPAAAQTDSAPAAAAAPANSPPVPAPAAGVDPVTLMPSSVAVYMNINLDAGNQYLDSMKGTRLGQDFQTLLTGEQNPTLRTVKVMMALLQGFGTHIGVGVVLPKSVVTVKPTPSPVPSIAIGGLLSGGAAPEIVIVAPVVDQAMVHGEADLIGRLGAAGAGWTWRNEPEGAETVHVATGSIKPGQPLPSYALVPGALIFSTSGPLVHAALKQFHRQTKGLADIPRLQELGARIDRTQLAWGFFNPSAVPGIPVRQPDTQIGPASAPGPAQLLASLQGAAFSVTMHPDRMDMQILQAYDGTSDVGKAMRAFESQPITAPNLAFGRSTAFLDIADMPHAAVLFDQLITPMIQVMNAQVADTAGGKPFSELIAKVMGSVSDVVHGSGSELAVDIGPVTGQPQAPPGIILIGKGDDPKLQTGITTILDTFAQVGHLQSSTTQVLDTSVRVLTPTPPGGPRLSYGMAGDFHVIALDLNDLKTPLYHAKGVNPGSSLASDPQFKAVWDLLGPKTTQLLYVDEHSLLQAQGTKPAAATGPGGTAAVGQPGLTRAGSPTAAGPDPAGLFGQEIINDLRGFGEASYPDPMGLTSRVVITYDANAAPAATPPPTGGKVVTP